MSKQVVQQVTQQVKPGVPYMMLITITFIVLKVTHTVAWSWWLVLLPLYLAPAVFFAFLALFGIVALVSVIVYVLVEVFTTKRKRPLF